MLWWMKSQNARAQRDPGATGRNDSRMRMKIMMMKTVKSAET